MAEREGFEPSVPFWGTHDFQSCAFNRSATSPYWNIENLGPCPSGSTVNDSKMSSSSFLGRFAELLFSEVNTSFRGSKDRMRETGF